MLGEHMTCSTVSVPVPSHRGENCKLVPELLNLINCVH